MTTILIILSAVLLLTVIILLIKLHDLNQTIEDIQQDKAQWQADKRNFIYQYNRQKVAEICRQAQRNKYT